MGGRQIKQEKTTVINEDDLTWLARNVHEWNFFIDAIASVSNGKVTWLDPNIHSKTDGITRAQWLARRAELQGKPSWEDAPEWAEWMAQHESGRWCWGHSAATAAECQGCTGVWWIEGIGAPRWSGVAGEALGDWRDTLEHRPEPDISANCPACGSKGIHACLGSKTDGEVEDSEDMIERVYWEFDSERAKKLNPERDIFKRYVRSAMKHVGPAEGLIRLLTTSPDNFTASELGDIHQLVDVELTKRDAAVCGGQKYLDAHWFERGELPPVGILCEAIVTSERLWVEIEVVCHRDGFVLGWCPKEMCGYHGDEPTDFRPLRTEREKAIDEMMEFGGLRARDGARMVYGNLYDAGYRKPTTDQS